MISAIPSKDINLVWDIVQPMLENVPDFIEEKNLEGILDDLLNAKMQLWIIDNFQAVLVTEIKGDKCLLYMVSGAGMKNWKDDVIKQIESWAIDIGCKTMMAIGRKGWERTGRQYGYSHAYTALQKELNHGR